MSFCSYLRKFPYVLEKHSFQEFSRDASDLNISNIGPLLNFFFKVFQVTFEKQERLKSLSTISVQGFFMSCIFVQLTSSMKLKPTKIQLTSVLRTLLIKKQRDCLKNVKLNDYVLLQFQLLLLVLVIDRLKLQSQPPKISNFNNESITDKTRI